MATDTKTWAWGTDLESWSMTGFSYWTGTRDATEGSGGAGCLKATISAKNKAETAYWSFSDTWANIFSAITAGDTVTQIRLYGLETKGLTFTGLITEARYSNSTGTNTNALWTDCLSSGNELWAGRQVTAAEGSWTSHGPGSNQAVAAGYQAGSSTIELRLYVFGDIGNDSGASLQLLHDDLVVEATYSTTRIPRSASMCPILGG